MNTILEQNALQTLTIYPSIRQDALIVTMEKLINAIRKQKPEKAVRRYNELCAILYRSEFCGNLCDYVTDLVLRDENIFTVHAANQTLSELPRVVQTAVDRDLSILQALSLLDSHTVKKLLVRRFPEQEVLIRQMPDYLTEPTLFEHLNNAQAVANYHRQNGTGIFSKYLAFYLAEDRQLVPVKEPILFPLDGLKKYEMQKRQVVDNTRSFLQGKPANNVLLYGDRGTGKSTMVHAILQEYHREGLRMIQIKREDILHLGVLMDTIRKIPLYFIIFIDDLTFNENDVTFNTLKAILEGSLNGMPQNVLIYATTNRRHLIKETFTAREGDELHAADTRDENASLADRFGLTVTFSKPTLPEYLEIVQAIALDRGIVVDEAALKRGASTFATRKGSRSGRVAKQYVDYVEGRLALNLPI